MGMNMFLWTFVSETGRDALLEWASEIRLPTRVRAIVDQKLDVLRQQPFETIIHTNLLAGPIAKQGHIYNLQINREVTVRLMLCRGPLSADVGYTLLLGAVERDGRLVPAEAPEMATRNRELVVTDPDRRRKPYERFGKTID
jgi:hypothetical protein